MWHSPYCFIVIIDYNHKVFNRILANTLILVLFYVVPARERFIQESRNDTVAWMKAEPAPASSSPSSSDLKLPYLLVQVLKQSLKKSGNMSTSDVRTPRPAKTPAWSVPPMMTSPMDDPSSCSDNASDNSDKLDTFCQAPVQNSATKTRKRKMVSVGGGGGSGGGQGFVNQGGPMNGAVEQNSAAGAGRGGVQQNTGSLWAEAESLAADFDGSLSGLGADLSNNSYDMSEALLALPSLYNNRNANNSSPQAQNPPNVPSGFIKEAGLTPLAAAHLHGGSSVSLPGDFHFEGHSSSSCQQNNASGNTGHHHPQDPIHLDCERRFQYVLAAATSTATKVNEETLTYLNQNQPYEIKLKKLGELTAYRGVVFRSVVRLCFHDRRLQFSEREQIALWEDSHPNDRILQVDLPLSYGVTLLHQSQGYETPTNQIQFLWEPLKEVGLYVKINCISTEFTPKKHGGEKGVPFRMMIETYSHPDNARLHAAACQVKVFKLKGADRKHKQDREKIMKKTPVEQAKLQPSYECTVFSDVPLESLESPPSTVQSTHTAMLSPLYSSDHPHADSPENHSNSGNGSSGGQTSAVNYPAVAAAAAAAQGGTFSAHYSPESVRRWLIKNRFGSTKTLWDFSGLDLMRLSKEELVEMCGLAEGIRLYNALHYKITFFITVINEIKNENGPSSAESNTSMNGPGVCSTSGTNLDHDTIFHPVCLSSPSIIELTSVLSSLFSSQCPQDSQPVERLLLSVCAPGNTTRIRVLLTEQLLSTLKDQTAFKALKKNGEIFLEIVE